jgi:hypothetical protein
MSKPIAIAAGAGALSAGLYLSTLLGSIGAIILAYLSTLPLFATGLALGLWPVLTAATTGVVITGIVDTPLTALLYGALSAAPVAWMIHLALLSRSSPDGAEWYPGGRLATWLAAIASGYFVIALVVLSGDEGGLRGRIDSFLTMIFERIAQRPVAEIEGAEGLIASWEPLFPAFVGLSWMIMMVVNGVLAQGLVSRFGRNLRPAPLLKALQLPRMLAYALAGALATSLVPGTVGYAGTTIAIYLLVPYLLLGLATVHALAARLPTPQLVLVVFYFTLVMFGLFALASIAGLGLIEQWFNLRRRLGVVYKGEEE